MKVNISVEFDDLFNEDGIRELKNAVVLNLADAFENNYFEREDIIKEMQNTIRSRVNNLLNKEQIEILVNDIKTSVTEKITNKVIEKGIQLKI